MRSVGNPPRINVYGLRDLLNTPGNSDTSGKQRLFPTLDANTGIFVTLGQSRISNISATGSTVYTPTNTNACLNLNPYDGIIYRLNDPILGATYSPLSAVQMISWHGRLADKLITAGKYTQVLFIPIAISGTSVTDWITGGGANSRIYVAASWLTYYGWTPSAWLWMQGTTDVIAGMSQANYQTNLRSVISYERSLAGRSADKWIIAQDSVKDATGTTNAAIRAAQAAVAADAGNYAGPDCDTISNAYYDASTHFNDNGNDAVAGLWSTNIQARL